MSEISLLARRSARWSPLALAIVIGIAAPAALAQDDAKELERVEVTGSRIKKTEIEGQSPIFTLERSDIEQTGLTSVGDVLQQLVTGGKALNSRFNSSGNFGFPADGGGIGAGSSQVDLRNLESKRVLVLVDGKRWVNESSASGIGGSVDLNTIPLAIVERIEVLEDGASAIYGSDAISGVINIITRRRFEGVDLTTYYGEYDEGDGETTRAEVTWGGGNDRFNGVFSVSYNEQKRVSSADRDQSDEPVPGTGLTRGSSGTPQGRFIFCDPRVNNCGNVVSLTTPPGTGTLRYDPQNPTGPNSSFIPFSNNTRFNFAPFNLVVTPNTRRSLFVATDFALTDTINWYAKGLYNNRESVNQAAPEPIFIGGDAGTGGLADTISISRLNPFNPFGIDLVAGENFFLLGRRPIEAGPRIFEQDVDTWYFGTGLEGTFVWGDRTYSWDVNYLNTENDAEQTFRNGFNLRRMQLALGDPAACSAVQGCVPLNLFGGQGTGGAGTITQQMLDWVRITTKDSSEQQLEVFSANLTGDLFELPAGPLAFATGYEHRDYEGSFTPDQVRIVGESQDSRAELAGGQYDVDELYAEFSVPLLTDAAIAKELSLSLAVRYSDYSTFGSETTSKAGFKWRIVDDFLVRGTYAEGFRAPFLGELFGLAQFGAVLTDPCSNATGATRANCAAIGVPAGYEQINPQITTNTGGNPLLEPESADSYTLGLVYSPGWAEDLSWASRLNFEVSYWNHDIEDAIQAPDAQALLDRCVASQNAAVGCTIGGQPAIRRTPSGAINRFDNLLANIGQIETDGFDFKVDWAAPETSWGQFGATLEATNVSEYKAQDVFGNVFGRREGIEINDSAIPEWQANLGIDWRLGDFSASWNVRYIDSVTESCSDFLDGTPNSLTNLGLCSNPNASDNSLSTNELGSTVYNDLQFGWRNPFGVEDLALTVGVNNAFDKDPPICLSCSLNGYDAGTYDIPGQFWYVQANYKF
jgi:iron complex outermembrane receptor protein